MDVTTTSGANKQCRLATIKDFRHDNLRSCSRTSTSSSSSSPVSSVGPGDTPEADDNNETSTRLRNVYDDNTTTLRHQEYEDCDISGQRSKLKIFKDFPTSSGVAWRPTLSDVKDFLPIAPHIIIIPATLEPNGQEIVHSSSSVMDFPSSRSSGLRILPLTAVLRVGWPGDPPSRMWLFVVWCWMPCNLHDMCLFPCSTWRSIRRPISRLISPQSRSFSHSHTGVLKGLSCGSLWGLSLSCRVYSVDASSHRFRPKCTRRVLNERSLVATVSDFVSLAELVDDC